MKFMKTLVFLPGRFRHPLLRSVAALAASFLSSLPLPPYFSFIHFPRAKLGARLYAESTSTRDVLFAIH